MFKGLYNGSQKHSADLDKVIERAQSNGIDKVLDFKRLIFAVCKTFLFDR